MKDLYQEADYEASPDFPISEFIPAPRPRFNKTMTHNVTQTTTTTTSPTPTLIESQNVTQAQSAYQPPLFAIIPSAIAVLIIAFVVIRRARRRVYHDARDHE